MLRTLLTTVALAIMLMLTSCGNNGCEETRETYLLTQVKPTGRISIVSLNAWGLGHQTDSLMLSVGRPTELEFILRPDTTETRIRIEMTVNDNGDMFKYDDTLTIAYDPVPYFLNMECGCSMFFTLQDVSVTNHLLRTVKIKNKEITNEEQINIVLEY